MKQLRDDTGGLLRDSPAARAELEVAKTRVLDQPWRLDLRLELAEAYRVRGFPDQAGRWGILTEGWPNELELDRFARLLAASGVRFGDVREFLLLPDEVDLPEAVIELFAGPVRSYRSTFLAQRRGFDPEGDAAFIAARAIWTFGSAALVTLLVSTVVVFTFTIAESSWAVSLAWLGLFATAFFAALSLLALASLGVIKIARLINSPASE